jgi:hypothetical protein
MTLTLEAGDVVDFQRRREDTFATLDGERERRLLLARCETFEKVVESPSGVTSVFY